MEARHKPGVCVDHMATDELMGILAADTSPMIERVLALARTHLQMEVSFLSEFTAGKQIYRAVDGSGGSFGIVLGEGPELGDTYCHQMVAGHIPNAVPDTRTEVSLRNLASTLERRVGSYVGVPLWLSDGTLYGTFCCLGHDAESLDDRDVKFMSMLAEVLVKELDDDQEARQKRDTIADILTADALTIAFQPIVSLGEGRCLGVEALSRFADGGGSPDHVFEMAHSVGLGEQLEELAARQAVNFLPLIPEPQYLAINLSPQVARDASDRILDVTGESLQRLVLEVTEAAAVEGYDRLRDRLAPIRERGLRLAIDDAGAGYASLHHIVELCPDIIKIDRSLVHGMAVDRYRRSAVRAFVALAQDLGAATVAEGIETSEDLRVARELGITAAQGYLLGKPTTEFADISRRYGTTATPQNHPQTSA